MSRDVALGTADVWDGLRLVVLDVEMTVGPDRGRLRAVSLGVATVRAARITGQWHRLIDPDTPIDAASQRIHHLTDELVAGEPTFDQIADELLALLEPRGGETVWVAAHNALFDVSVLRHELKRFGRDLPDIPVIDTMGPLVSVAGLSVKQPSLATLAAELSLTNPNPHDALADAPTCAQAAIELLARARRTGITDRSALLDACAAPHRAFPLGRERLVRQRGLTSRDTDGCRVLAGHPAVSSPRRA